MGRYRETRFEPGYRQLPAPAHPFNAVRWSGVALILVGAAALVLIAGSRIGWLPRLGNTDLVPLVPLTAVGSALVNAGRRQGTEFAIAPERRRWMLIVVTICAAVFSAAIIIDIARS